MRTIKYRAWSKKFKKMRRVSLLGSKRFKVWSDNRWYPINDKFVVMQSIGLLDNKDKDIYEGDVVVMPNGEVKSVWWERQGFFIGSNPARQYAPYELEVWSNIYEKPNLVK